MRHARALLPYVTAGLLIAGASSALVLGTVGTQDVRTGSTADARTAPQLSPTGRLAYWRQNPAGAFILFAANFDGSLARPLLTLAPNASRPFGTRWTRDGGAVAFVNDLGISVVGIDGTRADLPLPPAIRNAGYRVIDQRWSPTGGKVAATVYRSTDGKSDVYLGSRERGELTRSGDLGNAFAGEWLSEDEVLVESDRGSLGALRESGALRKLADQSAASGVIDGGRVYFLAGPVTTNGDGSGIYVQSPTVWSVAPDGTGGRREDRLGIGADLKLDGRWPDGRYLVHQIRDVAQYLAAPGAKLVSVSATTGTVLRRVVVSADRGSAIGFGAGRLVRIDLTRGLTPGEGAFVVLLDGIVAADVWVRGRAFG